MAGSFAAGTGSSIADLITASRTLGRPDLTLHGGGNTSLKGEWLDVTGELVPALLVKGSGHALASIDADGFAPLRLERLRQLLPPTSVASDDLANELRCAVLDSDAPDPSVETLVHALLPHKAVFHSHADAILTLTNTPEGGELVAELFGGRVLVVEYAMPGTELAAAIAGAWELAGTRQASLEGIVVLQHGLFTMGDSPAQALDRHLDMVAVAGKYIADARAGAKPSPSREPLKGYDTAVRLAALRARISRVAGGPLVMTRDTSEEASRALADPAVLSAVAEGPLTPDHVVWTGYRPLLGDDVDNYVDGHEEYVRSNRVRRGEDYEPEPVAPRVLLDPELGILSVGRTARETRIVEDITRHTLTSVADSNLLGGYRPADPSHVFDLDHWAPQGRKRSRAARSLPLVGHVALVTGAASGIGQACAAELLSQGASVVGWDRSESVVEAFDSPEWHGIRVDVTDPVAQREALTTTVDRFGGLDILVVAAGVFPTAQHIGQLDATQWRKAMSVNVDSVAELFRLAHPLLATSPVGGRVCVVASKNVAAPGPGAAAYSASKAALTQLTRVAALEWAPDGIRINLVHPDAVFDTALWTPELLAARAAHYGMTEDEYKRRNLLRTEIRSADVGRAVRASVDNTLRCTTGAHLPVDGGNERVI
ncbi:SDR family oxidoreductase [Streptomyces sp. NPDC005921]|uniref:SDR family oxidoreductase n=1 Tax=Streptomyces sp. NPDC005827 TaxID=3157070 RepID=UPI0033F02001